MNKLVDSYDDLDEALPAPDNEQDFNSSLPTDSGAEQNEEKIDLNRYIDDDFG